MASNRKTVDTIVEQTAAAGTVTTRAMFGEYALYCDGKLVALICEDQLFVKPTKAGRDFIGPVPERPPYAGAKPYLWIAGERWEDSEWLAAVIRVSAEELPRPVKRTRKGQ